MSLKNLIETPFCHGRARSSRAVDTSAATGDDDEDHGERCKETTARILYNPASQRPDLPCPATGERVPLQGLHQPRRANRRRGRCCRCLALTVALLSLLVFSLAAVTGILYLVLRPKLPRYSIDAISIRGLDLSAAGPKSNPDLTLSPLIDVTVRAENPNRKIGIDYRHGSSVAVSYSDVVLCRGIWPSFYQGKRNVTVFQTALKGSGIRLADATLGNLTAAQRRRQVPLEIGVRVPVRVKLGAITSWTINVKVHCDVTVDKLTADSKFISKNCKKRLGEKCFTA
ncbi:hypothetical protein HPP92_017601 [Vanilla planifolia]|uniref:Late embryogenesis abundant protein LEA-2 subgroup domain-containing protein n=1 Tax=Vanilla planifolia TaxID=51239 RepID=A0A835QGE0_VANPL|nr:hypothetical protein HPP92_017601 [Vanilla planifolia]